VAEHPIPEEDRNLSRESDGERRVATPTATESQLPWKRQGDECTDAVQQNEFPAWASNKEYLAYNSPSATFLGNVCNTQLFKLFRIFNKGMGNVFFDNHTTISERLFWGSPMIVLLIYSCPQLFTVCKLVKPSMAARRKITEMIDWPQI